MGDGETVTINGIAKGAGMIAPDMATMLSFIATDAAVSPGRAAGDGRPRRWPAASTRITIDSDTSTSDTRAGCFATGKRLGRRADDRDGRSAPAGFQSAL
jgi:glutamate N-acetyltransferase/amino-acid N-acetyltransferase